MEKRLTAAVSPLGAASNASTFLDSPPVPPLRQHSTGIDATAAVAAAEAPVGTAVVRMARTRAPKRARRQDDGGGRGRLALVVEASLRDSRSFLMQPDMVMKLSTIASATGGFCLVLMVFSGQVLVYLAVIALGLCGMCYSVRQRGALQYLPRGMVDLLTQTTLLEFLTDTSVFDAVKNYLVFMMGLSADETQAVLSSLPIDMHRTLTRPGLMHTLPRPLQGLLLPANPSASPSTSRRAARLPAASAGVGVGASPPNRDEVEEGGRTRRRRRRRRPDAVETLDGGLGGGGGGGGGVARDGIGAGGRFGEHGREYPLGQLVWNPLPPLVAPAPVPAPQDENAEQVSGDPSGRGVYGAEELLIGENRAARREGVDSGESEESEGGEEEGEGGEEEEEEEAEGKEEVGGGGEEGGEDEEEEEEGGEGRGGRREYGGVFSGPAHRRPWEGSPPAQPRFPSPETSQRGRARGRVAAESRGGGPSLSVNEREGFQSPGRRSPALPEPAARRVGAGGVGGTDSRNRGRGVAMPDELMPSAERIVASILQRRMDSAWKSAWNMVDERGVRRAAVGSGIALAAHVAFSERARRQAGSMLRGSLLATLAGTVTVCAGLVYLKPEAETPDQISISAAASISPSRDRPAAAAATAAVAVGAGGEGGASGSRDPSGREGGEEGEGLGLPEVGGGTTRLSKYRAGLRRCITALSPSAKNLVRLLGMICVLLAVRKWQVLRRAAIRAGLPPTMYGGVPR